MMKSIISTLLLLILFVNQSLSLNTINVVTPINITSYQHDGSTTISIIGTGFSSDQLNNTSIQFGSNLIGSDNIQSIASSLLVATIPLDQTNGPLTVLINNANASNTIQCNLTPYIIDNTNFMLNVGGGQLNITGRYLNTKRWDSSKTNVSFVMTLTLTNTGKVYTTSCTGASNSGSNQWMTCNYPSGGGNNYQIQFSIDSVSYQGNQVTLAYYPPAVVSYNENGLSHLLTVSNFTTYKTSAVMFASNAPNYDNFTAVQFQFQQYNNQLSLASGAVNQDGYLLINCTNQIVKYFIQIYPYVQTVPNGYPGQSINVTGVYFTDVSQVLVNNQSVSFNLLSVTTSQQQQIITVTLPSDGVGLQVPISLVTQSNRVSNVQAFNYGPVIQSISNQGTTISVVGLNFGSDSKFLIAGSQQSQSQLIPTSIINQTILVFTNAPADLLNSNISVSSSSLISPVIAYSFTPTISNSFTFTLQQQQQITLYLGGSYLSLVDASGNELSISLLVNGVTVTSVQSDLDNQQLIANATLPSDLSAPITIQLTIAQQSAPAYNVTIDQPSVTIANQVNGGTNVTITGVSLGNNQIPPVVTLNNIPVQGCLILSEQSLLCQMTQVGLYNGQLAVQAHGFTSNLVSLTFTPLVTVAGPVYPLQPSQSLSITGYYFANSSTTLVNNGLNQSCTSVVYVNSQLVTCTLSLSTLQSNPTFAITVASQTSPVSPVEYLQPTIQSTSFNGTMATLNGSNIIQYSTVSIDNVDTTCTGVSGQNIQCDITKCASCYQSCTPVIYKDTENVATYVYYQVPQLISIEPASEYYLTTVKANIFCSNTTLLPEFVEDFVEITIGGLTCDSVRAVDLQTFTCGVPAGDTNDKEVVFTFMGKSSKENVLFKSDSSRLIAGIFSFLSILFTLLLL